MKHLLIGYLLKYGYFAVLALVFIGIPLAGSWGYAEEHGNMLLFYLGFQLATAFFVWLAWHDPEDWLQQRTISAWRYRPHRR